ncbi:MAG: hypothetical protein ACE5FQ_11925 [Thiogranum sp.]
MKISDKALQLIGRIILGSMDSKTNPNNQRLPLKTPYPKPAPRFSLNLQAPVKAVKAPVLPFRKEDPES